MGNDTYRGNRFTTDHGWLVLFTRIWNGMGGNCLRKCAVYLKNANFYESIYEFRSNRTSSIEIWILFKQNSGIFDSNAKSDANISLLKSSDPVKNVYTTIALYIQTTKMLLFSKICLDSFYNFVNEKLMKIEQHVLITKCRVTFKNSKLIIMVNRYIDHSKKQYVFYFPHNLKLMHFFLVYLSMSKVQEKFVDYAIFIILFFYF